MLDYKTFLTITCHVINKKKIQSLGLKSKLLGLKSKLLGLKSKLLGLKSKLLGLKSKLLGLKSKLLGLKSKLLGLKKKSYWSVKKVTGLKSKSLLCCYYVITKIISTLCKLVLLTTVLYNELSIRFLLCYYENNFICLIIKHF